MIKKISGFLVLVLILSWTNQLSASKTNPQTGTITLEKAIRLALQHNPGLKQSGNQVQLNQSAVNRNKASFLPDLRVSANTTQNWSKKYDAPTDRYQGQGYTTANMSARSTLTLFDGFYNSQTLKQSRLELQSSQSDLNRTNQSVIFETAQRFINVVLAKELIQVDRENLEAQKLQLQLIKDYCEAGKRPITDLHQQQAEISQSEYQLLSSQRNLEVNKLLLKQTMGLEPDTDYQVEQLPIDNLIKDIQINTSKSFTADPRIEQALRERPDVEAQQFDTAAAEKGIKIAKSGYFPTITLFAEFGSNYNGLSGSQAFSSQFFDNNLSGSIGLSFSIPIFDKKTTKHAVTTAKINLNNRQLEMKRLKDQITVEVRQAIEDYKTAAKQMKVSEDRLTYAKAALESIEARYKVNAATMVELTQSRAGYLEASYNRVQAKYNLYLQTIAVAYYTGDSREMFAAVK